MGSVVEATAETFREAVSAGTVLVDVWGPHCAPCLALMPHVERLAAERPELTVVKLDATKARRLCIDLRIASVPAFLMLVDGREIARLAERSHSPERLRAWVEATLGSARNDAIRNEEVS